MAAELGKTRVRPRGGPCFRPRSLLAVLEAKPESVRNWGSASRVPFSLDGNVQEGTLTSLCTLSFQFGAAPTALGTWLALGALSVPHSSGRVPGSPATVRPSQIEYRPGCRSSTRPCSSRTFSLKPCSRAAVFFANGLRVPSHPRQHSARVPVTCASVSWNRLCSNKGRSAREPGTHGGRRPPGQEPPAWRAQVPEL